MTPNKSLEGDRDSSGPHRARGVCEAMLAAVLLAGCVTYKLLPEGYTGPRTFLSDSVVPETYKKAQFFVALEVDGFPIANSIGETASANRGNGFFLLTKVSYRELPMRTMRVKLRGTHVTGAPIHALLSQAVGTFFSVEGVVDFTPEIGKVYVVWGELKDTGSSVWIAEKESKNQPVTEKVLAK